jgi:hypothetical protein
MSIVKKHKQFSTRKLSLSENKTYEVIVQWHQGQDGFWWNETCAKVLTVFGLPGDRYRYSPEMDKMTFFFGNEADQFTCKILLSDRL